LIVAPVLARWVSEPGHVGRLPEAAAILEEHMDGCALGDLRRLEVSQVFGCVVEDDEVASERVARVDGSRLKHDLEAAEPSFLANDDSEDEERLHRDEHCEQEQPSVL